MPAIITHHLFGTAIQSRLGEDAFPTNDELSAFLLGNQGPDPLFYIVFSRKMIEVKRLGSDMHQRNMARSLDAMREFARALTGDSKSIADAYLKGFICHYTLDRTAHPFIYAQQNQITGAGVKGLGPESGGFVHSQIETDIDAALLERMLGQTIATWRVHDHVLIASNEVLNVIDKLYRYAAAGVYGVVLPAGQYVRAVKDFRISVAVLHSPTGKVRSLVGDTERIFRRHSVAQALSHRVDVGEHSEWDNVERAAWQNPFTGETSNASFDDLFEQAQDLALDNIKLHEELRPSFEITGTYNFSGDPELK